MARVYHPKLSRKSGKKAFIDIGKKILDVSDDIWRASRNILPEFISSALNPFVLGTLGGLIHLFEGHTALKRFLRALRNKRALQRKTKIITSSISIGCAGVGTGFSVALVLSGLGVEVLGASLFQIIIPALLTGIYTLSLGRLSYRLHIAKVEEAAAEATLKALGPAADPYRLLVAQMRCDFWKNERLTAERKVAFGTIEVTASVIALVGTILMAGVVATLSVGTFGIPLAIILVGVVIGFSLKALEYLDGKKEHKITLGIRNWITKCWDSMFKKKSPQPVEKLDPNHQQIKGSTLNIFGKLKDAPTPERKIAVLAEPMLSTATYKETRKEGDLQTGLNVPISAFFSKIYNFFAHGNKKIPTTTPVYYHALKL